MAQWMTLVLAIVATTVCLVESRAIPAEPISVMLDPYGNPIVFLREKRMAVQPYPHRAMMFTGYYRPVRRSSNGGQATGVFAQGNAVSGEAFFGGMQAPHLKNGPEPIEEPEVSSAEAQAAPAADEAFNEEEEEQTPVQDEERYHPEEHHHHDEHHQQDEHHHQEEHHHHHQQDEHHHHQDEHHQQEEEQHHDHHQQDDLPTQEQHEPEPVPVFTTEAPIAATHPAEEPVSSNTEVSVNRPKVHHGKKNKKTPVVVDDDDEEDEEEDDEPVVPFVPFKGNRRRQGYPHLNNFFPMVFSFPGVATRAGSSGSPPGAVTAIANSYSTGKGGVASSVATAYGGSPNGKKRRTPPAEE